MCLAACHHKSQTCEAVGAKGKRFYSGAVQSGRMADSCLKAHLLSQTKTKASVQSSCSNVKYSPLEPTGRNILASSACSWLLFISGSPSWSLQVVPAQPWAMWLLGPHSHKLQVRVNECISQCITRWARERERLPPGGHRPRGCYGHVTNERTSQFME